MAYTPPVGTANLSIGSVLGYTPPVGTVNLTIGHLDTDDRVAVLAGTTTAPSGQFTAIKARQAILSGTTSVPAGQLTALRSRVATLSGTTPTPSGLISVRRSVFGVISGTTAAPTGHVGGVYDPNLLSEVCHGLRQDWQDSQQVPSGILAGFRPATPLQVSGPGHWQEGDLEVSGLDSRWSVAELSLHIANPAWQEALQQGAGRTSLWSDASRLETCSASFWQEGEWSGTSFVPRFQTSQNRLELNIYPVWQHGATSGRSVRDRMRDGVFSLKATVEVWQEAGFVWNANNLPKDSPRPPLPPQYVTRLRIWCSLPGTSLRIGRTQCPLIPELDIPFRSSYVSVNSASLTLLPNRTPLPCTSMTIKTDANSWCWGLSASLTGPSAWALVQPTPAGYPVEVEATINGWIWTFVLDYPGLTRKFNNHNLTIEGRSRSAWLSEPWTPRAIGRQANARTAQQLAEEALENTGWTLDWLLDDWAVPGGRFEWDNDIVGRIMRLLKPVDGCLYTDPSLQVLTAYPRYAVASWLWAAETADWELPESIVSELRRQPNITNHFNGVYVSGTTDGVLAFVKIAGTDGALQPGQPITEALICDDDGVAARMRGLSFLSQNGGTGYQLSLRTLLGHYEALGDLPTLLLPTMLIKHSSQNGRVRSISVNASRSGGWTGILNVSQTVEIEGWEVEV